jgi:hypothetical protein
MSTPGKDVRAETTNQFAKGEIVTLQRGQTFTDGMFDQAGQVIDFQLVH